MSSSSASSKPPPHLLLHVDTTTTTTNGSSAAASPGSGSSTPSSSRSPRPSVSGGGGGGGGQNQACAACKYQRRKCNPDCPLARYFPADQQRRFLNAHKLFGVSNIQKTLRRIDPEYGPEAMRALIYQSEARAADPVYGCVRIIKELERQLHMAHAEINAVHHQIAIYRQATAAGGDPAIAADPAMLAAAAQGHDNNNNNVVMAMDALYGGADQQVQEAGAGFAFVHHHDHQQQQDYHHHHALKADDDEAVGNAAAHHPLYDYFCYDAAAGDEASSHEAAGGGGGVHEYCYSSDGASVKNGSSPMTTLGEQMEQHCQIEAAPFVDAFDVKPEDLPVAMAHHGDGIEQPEQKVPAAVVKYDHDADQKMAEPPAQCHLELGFSASF
ncbi:hypothetical protein EJB05_54790, partial [Eragrostis curvula]